MNICIYFSSCSIPNDLPWNKSSKFLFSLFSFVPSSPLILHLPLKSSLYHVISKNHSNPIDFLGSVWSVSIYYCLPWLPDFQLNRNASLILILSCWPFCFLYLDFTLSAMIPSLAYDLSSILWILIIFSFQQFLTLV